MAAPNPHHPYGEPAYNRDPVKRELPASGVPAPRRRTAVVTSPAAGKTVLCIDDSEPVLEMTQVFLRACGFRVLTALGGREGVGLALSESIDAVVLDYDMPDLDGPAVATLVKSAKPTVPVILYSGHRREIVEPALSLVDGFVQKGTSPSILAAELGRLLTGTPTGTSTRQFRRFAVELEFCITITRPGYVALRRGVAVDLSEGGLRGVIEGDLNPGELIEFQLQLPRSRVVLEVQAQVRYRNGPSYGFEFVQLGAVQEEHLRRCCRELAVA